MSQPRSFQERPQAGLLELLAHPYRRFVLQYLTDTDETTLSELATELGSWQTTLPPDERTAEGIDDVEIALHHHHLPKMAEMDVVVYDPERRVVALGDRATDARTYLDDGVIQ